MSKFGGGGDSTNRELVEMQKTEAAQAAAKERARQERLRYGRQVIEATFGGGTVQGLPTYRTKRVWQPPGTTTDTSGLTPWEQATLGLEGVKGNADRGSTATHTPGQWVNERVRVPGRPKTYEGIGQDFYEGYRDALSSFYQPTVNQQFREAKSQNLFDLARKGLLRSSVAADRAGDLVRDRAEANAKIASEIEGQVTGLRTDVNNAKRNAYNLLTSTEDPTTAANAALTEVNAIQTRKPSFNALGDLFASALNSYSTFRNAQAGREAVASIPSRSPYQSSGRNYA
jgi:hypothetical protein